MKIIEIISRMKYLLFLILMMTGITMATENHTSQVKYQLRFKTNSISCIVRVNDVFIYNTRDAGKSIPIQMSFGQDITQYLVQGENTLSIEASNLAEYISENNISNSYCEVDIIAMVVNPDTGRTENRVVNNIRYTYVNKPDNSNLNFPYLLSVIDSNVTLDEELSSNDIGLIQLPHIYDADKEAIQKTLATREFTVNHHQPFSWVNDSTPFEDTPENRQKLWDKYQEILRAVANKDKKAVRKLVEPGVTDMANYYGDGDAEVQFEFSFADTFQHYFDLNPNVYQEDSLTLDDYDLELYADGRLFRLNQKGYVLISPIQWKNTIRGTSRVYNPIFTFINGEIVMAWF